MGGIGCVTPDSRRSRHTIKRSTKLVKADVTGEFGKVAIKAYKKPFVSALSCIKVSSLFPDELNPRSQKLSFALDQLWMASMTLPVVNPNLGAPSPSWGGFMQLASKGEIYEKTRIEILPFIKMQPTNPSSIYTALNFAREQSSLHGMKTCFVTFDQPLCAKAIEIVASDEILQGVVVRLGGFHLLMSFHGFSWLYHGWQWTRSSMGISLCPSISGAYDDRSCTRQKKVFRLYTRLSLMQALQSTMNETEFGKFTKDGYFTISRKDNLWGEIYSDQSIKQNLMRLLKTSGTQSIQYKSHREKHRINVELSSSLYAEKPKTPKAEIENAREEFLLKLYGSNKLGSTFDKLRHYKYKQAIEKSSLTSTIRLESLPPTSAAAAQHSYHQVHSTDLHATAWGWQMGDGILAPEETTKGVVPENLLKMVACGCKTQCKKSCGCRKLGLKCSSMCSHCEGEACSNRLEDL
ncbi:hypothetical protein CAPTEDRAFT_214834 [Capitella teleta]|uniref:Tesmin/TSO1-like CXC domain-containing protein n=1 Tax=Capitella teleta TaxID=283909 RepID=R7V812_CAPTE|nr:hypothetical protein CAPTEDRAFT_214834 [Capitella teleta]|eukprot:ELU12506.1 hypothetical protein CAPTEDRAFT_214834 [Capitella teleta]